MAEAANPVHMGLVLRGPATGQALPQIRFQTVLHKEDLRILGEKGHGLARQRDLAPGGPPCAGQQGKGGALTHAIAAQDAQQFPAVSLQI